jgi:hypothetical protein
MRVRLNLLVLGASLALSQQFPPIKDWKSVRITLERTSCLGSCPAYEVEVRDGVVRYRGTYPVYIAGERTGEIARLELQQLVDEFSRADYMKLSSMYGGLVMDASTATISVSIDGYSNTIVDATGPDGVEPTVAVVINGKTTTIADSSSRKAEIATVKALEQAIDRFAHTDKWVNGGIGALPPLRREEFKFTSPQARAPSSGR